MIIDGLQKLTLLDFPGYVACTIFTRACNFRCPFCQNAGLVLPEQFDDNATISEEDVLAFLKGRKNRLQGVCITGGEPTLNQTSLIDFIHKIRALGYKIKLDTNGSNPDALQSLLAEEMLDYIAMDIKSDWEHYPEMAGCPISQANLEQSIEIIENSGIKYEFRTTVTDKHSEAIFKNIGAMIGHATNYSLQYYEASDHVINPVFTTPTDEQMQKYADILANHADHVVIKGK